MSEMLELGTLLREERERKGITLEELSERIKLAPRTLAFIESGTKSELPHAVYVKGFVKSYAMVVGLDPEELGAMVDVAYRDDLEEEVVEPVIARRERKGSPVKLIAVIALVVVLAAVGYYVMQSSTATLDSEEATVEVPVQPKPAEQEPAVQEPVEQVEQPQVADVAPVEKVAPAKKQEAKTETKVKTKAKPAKPVAPKAVKAETKPNPVKTKPVVKKPAAPVVAPSDVVAQNAAEKATEQKADVPMRLLRIEATADCWIEASGEDFPRKEFLLRNGKRFTLAFPKNLSLRLEGNSGGISLTLDGVPYSFNGSDGKVPYRTYRRFIVLMEFTEKVIILRIGRFKEADLWVRFLSPTRGIMNAFAFGGCRSRRRFCGCLDHLNQVLFRVKGSKLATYFSLEEGTLMDSPDKLRVSHERLGLAVNCQKFMEAMGISFEGAPAAYSLFLDMLALLNESEKLDKIWSIFFRARFAFDQGYNPELHVCQVCSNTLKYPVFHVQEGVLTCAACARSQGPRFRLSKESLDALRFVQENYPLRWTELNLSTKARKELSRSIDGFIQYHIGLSWENGMFRRV